MNKKQYNNFQINFRDFMKSEGITNLSSTSEEPFFSWHACECCGSSLGGNRENCNGYNPTTKEIKEYEYICDDCIYYAEYGRLDDMTMQEIEKE